MKNLMLSALLISLPFMAQSQEVESSLEAQVKPVGSHTTLLTLTSSGPLTITTIALVGVNQKIDSDFREKTIFPGQEEKILLNTALKNIDSIIFIYDDEKGDPHLLVHKF